MKKIFVIGLGPGGIDLLPLANYKALKNAGSVYFRTEKHPAVKDLIKELRAWTTFDQVYEEEKTFEEVYQKIVSTLITEQKSQVYYAVPGHPMVAERTVELLLDQAEGMKEKISIEIMPAMSFVDTICSSLKFDPIKGLVVADALQVEEHLIQPATATIWTQVYNQDLASDLKLALMDYYPDEHQVVLVRGAGIPQEEQILKLSLFELDRITWIDYLTSVFVPPLPIDQAIDSKYPLKSLVGVMAKLRSPEGCPWDREQDHKSLKPYVIEEAYEVVDAIEREDLDNLCEELGDLLLQVVFHCQIAQENAYFDINNVIMDIKKKLIRRHPHVFKTSVADTSEEVILQWDKIKEAEKAGKQGKQDARILDGIPGALPALTVATKLQKKAARVGFDWEDYRGAWEKVKEESSEVEELLVTGDKESLAKEIGDLLFAIVNLSRFFGIEPEDALRLTNRKFRNRFNYIEDQLKIEGLSFSEVNLEFMDNLWNKIKKME